jgi:hypothetical protein
VRKSPAEAGLVAAMLQAYWAEENHHEGPANPLHQHAGGRICFAGRPQSGQGGVARGWG